MAADSTMFLMVNLLIALSFGVQREQLEQRIGFTWPRPFLLRPLYSVSSARALFARSCLAIVLGRSLLDHIGDFCRAISKSLGLADGSSRSAVGVKCRCLAVMLDLRKCGWSVPRFSCRPEHVYLRDRDHGSLLCLRDSFETTSESIHSISPRTLHK